MAKILLLGCGVERSKRVRTRGLDTFDGDKVVAVDLNPDVNPDMVIDLNHNTVFCEDEEFDEIHAYEILEHLGQQGDVLNFFEEFKRYWKALRPGGALVGSVPAWTSIWAWGDPGHTRVLSAATFTYLAQAEYGKQVGKTSMSDYRRYWPKPFNFVLEFSEIRGEQYFFVLRKPLAVVV
jgi:hypothetical protein